MIGYLSGEIQVVGDGYLIINVGGVGYKVQYPLGSFLEGENAELYIHTAVRENDISLWGFKSIEEIRMFEQLIEVSGVGVRTGHTLVFSKGVDQIKQAIIMQDHTMMKVPGVGRKTAERIMLEMKDKVSDTEGLAMSENLKLDQNIVEDVLNASEKLGYKKADVLNVIKSMNDQKFDSAEHLLRQVLMKL